MSQNVSYDTNRAFRYAIKNAANSEQMQMLHEQYALWREGEPGKYLRNLEAFKLQRYFSPGTENAPLPALLKDHTGLHLAQLNFGFIPNWRSDRPKDDPLKAVDRAKKGVEIGRKTWNAANESMFDEEKHTWKDSAHDRRCVIFLEGFYQFHEQDGKMYPFFVSSTDFDAVPVAGLWDIADIDGQEYHTCAILMQEANEAMHQINNWGEHPHGPHRMPIILRPEDFAQWLDPIEQGDDEKIDALYKLIAPPPAGTLEYNSVALAADGRSVENAPEAHDPHTYKELELDVSAFNESPAE